MLKWDIDVRFARRAWLRRLVKLLLWNVAIGAMYALIFFVLRLDEIMADYMDATLAMTLLTLLMGNVTLALYDVALARFASIYIVRFRPKLFH